MNDSSYKFIRSNLRGLKRNRLLRLRTKIFCPECKTVRRVTDLFTTGTVVLDCKHRREVFNRTDAEVAEYRKALAEHEAKRQIVGKNRVNANGYCVTYVEDVAEETAA
jgi:hypothetical protein